MARFELEYGWRGRFSGLLFMGIREVAFERRMDPGLCHPHGGVSSAGVMAVGSECRGRAGSSSSLAPCTFTCPGDYRPLPAKHSQRGCTLPCKARLPRDVNSSPSNKSSSGRFGLVQSSPLFAAAFREALYPWRDGLGCSGMPRQCAVVAVPLLSMPQCFSALQRVAGCL